MGNYDELKQAVSDVIKTNGNQEITGQVLQNTLLSIINIVGANATFVGIATPTTIPGTPDQNIFYLATIEGRYINFDNIILPNGISVIYINNNQWAYKIILQYNVKFIDSEDYNRFNPYQVNIGFRLPAITSDEPFDGRLIKDANYSTSGYINVEDMPINMGQLYVYYAGLLGLPPSVNSYIWYQYDENYIAINTEEQNILHFDDIDPRPHFIGRPRRTANVKYIRVMVKTPYSGDIDYKQIKIAKTYYNNGIPENSFVNINGNSINEIMGQSLLATFVELGKSPNNAVSHQQLKADSNIIRFNDSILKESVDFSGDERAGGYQGTLNFGFYITEQNIKFNRIWFNFKMSKADNTQLYEFRVYLCKGVPKTNADFYAANTLLYTISIDKNKIPYENGGNIKGNLMYIDLPDSVILRNGQTLAILNTKGLLVAYRYTSNVGNKLNKVMYHHPNNPDSYWEIADDNLSWYSTEYQLEYINQYTFGNLKQFFNFIPSLKYLILGDSITAENYSWTNLFARLVNAEKLTNLAVAGAHWNDYYRDGIDVTEIDLSGNFDDGSGDTKNNVIFNQVLRFAQKITPKGEIISFTHPKTGETFTIPSDKGLGTEEIEIPNIIIIACGINDATQVGESGVGDFNSIISQTWNEQKRQYLFSSIRWAVESLKILAPDARIFLATPLYSTYYTAEIVDTIRDAIIKMGKYAGCSNPINLSDAGISLLFENHQSNGKYLEDGLHPNNRGRLLLARYYAQNIMKGYIYDSEVLNMPI
jgi:hypothetical protein